MSCGNCWLPRARQDSQQSEPVLPKIMGFGTRIMGSVKRQGRFCWSLLGLAWVGVNMGQNVVRGGLKVGQNDHVPLFRKVCMNLSMFVKYLAIYNIFETRV